VAAADQLGQQFVVCDSGAAGYAQAKLKFLPDFLGDPSANGKSLGTAAVDGVVLMGKSFSLSREFRRKSQTRSLLGEATSAAESPTSAAKRLRLDTSSRPMRLFFGEGSTSVSEKSLKSELVAADSDPLSRSMGTGDAVVALLL